MLNRRGFFGALAGLVVTSKVAPPATLQAYTKDVTPLEWSRIMSKLPTEACIVPLFGVPYEGCVTISEACITPPWTEPVQMVWSWRDCFGDPST